MRYSKITGHLETTKKLPRPTRGKWYDLDEFLELKDIAQDQQPAPRPPRVRHVDPLSSSTDYVPHSLGQEIDAGSDAEE